MRTARSPRLKLALATCALALVALTTGAAAPPSPPTLTAKARGAIVEGVITGLKDVYVFPEVAEKMAARLRERLAAGAYDTAVTVPAFCELLTDELRGVSHDLHIGVRWTPPPPNAGGAQPTDEQRRARFVEFMRQDNYCFEKVEHLDGNVGYLKLNCFADAGVAGATAIAAMGFLGGSDALIFDLRSNGGGTPSMIQLLSSYLFEEPTHLNSFYIRKGDETKQFWTQAYVPGPRLAKVPVFVLTSSRTFSGAEEFSYNLKNTKRGTIVGETTGGGAHPVRGHKVEGYDVTLAVPFGRAINPISGTNWEGKGVEPDIAVPAGQAFDVAYDKALEAVEANAKDEERKQGVTWLREGLAARAKPFAVTQEALGAFVGTYGSRVVALEGGSLVYQRQGRPKYALVPMAADLFVAPDLDWVRIRFERGPGGAVVRLVLLTPDGPPDPSERTGQ
ncbi:MAG: S41 family peptidase [Thermoanaerobaculaceae bacterium]